MEWIDIAKELPEERGLIFVAYSIYIDEWVYLYRVLTWNFEDNSGWEWYMYGGEEIKTEDLTDSIDYWCRFKQIEHPIKDKKFDGLRTNNRAYDCDPTTAD